MLIVTCRRIPSPKEGQGIMESRSNENSFLKWWYKGGLGAGWGRIQSVLPKVLNGTA